MSVCRCGVRDWRWPLPAVSPSPTGDEMSTTDPDVLWKQACRKYGPELFETLDEAIWLLRNPSKPMEPNYKERIQKFESLLDEIRRSRGVPTS
jgi:hypothetical protein